MSFKYTNTTWGKYTVRAFHSEEPYTDDDLESKFSTEQCILEYLTLFNALPKKGLLMWDGYEMLKLNDIVFSGINKTIDFYFIDGD